jgi:hypothetical protein
MRQLLASLLTFCVVLTSSRSHAIDPAGTVEQLLGTAIATMESGLPRLLYNGSTVLVGDRIETAAGSRIRIQLEDGGKLVMGESSTVTIEIYTPPTEDGSALMKAIAGIFLYASGTLAKLAPDRVTVETETAILGVRGTEIWGNVGDGSKLELALLSGAGVLVTTPQGVIELTVADTGVRFNKGEVPPEPRPWSAEKLEEARRTVSFD